jgi:hypothetical protein
MASAQVGSEVNAVICGVGSYVNISSPLSDTVVTEPVVTIRGSVQQASQLEVRVDANFNGIVPIAETLQTYETTVELTPGTHTIVLKAIDSCGTQNNEATVVLTSAPKPSQPSDGSTVPTSTGGVTIGEPVEQPEENTAGIVPPVIADTWDTILDWLNITTNDTSDSSAPRLSLLRALTLAAGTYLATIGLATTIVSFFAAHPPFTRFETTTERRKKASWFFRILGVVLLLCGFFL